MERAPLTLALHIATPWYRSWWFISLSTSAILLGIWGIIRFRERQLRKRNEDLEKQVEERTEKLYLMMENKNKFFNIVSHDLKSPLSHLNLLSEGLLEEFGQLDEEEKIRKIQLIHQVSSQGKALLDNLQLWVLSQKDIIRPAFRPTRLNDEIAAVLQLLDPHIRQKALTVSVPGQPVEVYTDKNMLSTILRNLISNAIKYSYPGGSIHIRVQETPQSWKVSVEDHGTGMPPERVDKLFQTGTKVSCRGTAQESGTGLGLLIVKEFINRLGETIQVKSIEGKGSIFTFTLQKHFNMIKVFIVDDSEIHLEEMKSILKQADTIQITAAARQPEEARQILQKESFDLAIVDISLAEEADGLDLAQFIKAHYPHLPVLILFPIIKTYPTSSGPCGFS